MIYVLIAALGFFTGAAATAWLMLISHLITVQKTKATP